MLVFESGARWDLRFAVAVRKDRAMTDAMEPEALDIPLIHVCINFIFKTIWRRVSGSNHHQIPLRVGGTVGVTPPPVTACCLYSFLQEVAAHTRYQYRLKDYNPAQLVQIYKRTLLTEMGVPDNQINEGAIKYIESAFTRETWLLEMCNVKGKQCYY